MTEDQKKTIDRIVGRIFSVPAGTIILSEGEVNLDMYKILQGHAELYIGYGTPKETLIGIIGPQACFGEFGLLLQKPALYTVVAYSELHLIRVSEGEMGDFVQTNHRSIIAIMRNMANTMLVMRKQIDMLLNDLEHGKKPDEETKHQLEKTVSTYTLSGGMSGRMWTADMEIGERRQ